MKTNIMIIAVIAVIILAVGVWLLLQNGAKGGLPSGAGIPNVIQNIGKKPQATEIIHFAPTAAGGEQKTGDCWASSLAAPGRNDAWQCNIEDQEYTYDPCFSLQSQDTVVCNADPISANSGFAVLLKKPLPAPAAVQAPRAWAWLIQLEDGTICAPFTGSRAQVNDKPATYGCKAAQGNANLVILGDLDAGKTSWIANVATISFDSKQIKADKVENIAVAKAWQ